MHKTGLLLPTLFLICSILAAGNAYAQARSGETELTAAAGVQSFYKLIENAFSYSGEINHSSGVYNISCRHYLTKRFTLGINLAYEHTHDSYSGTAFYGNNDWFTVAPELTYSYVDRLVRKNTSVRVYWLASWGLTLFSGSNGDGSTGHGYVPLGIQINPVGVRIGGNLAGFAEMGFGYRGLLNAGISYRFPKKKVAPELSHRLPQK